MWTATGLVRSHHVAASRVRRRWVLVLVAGLALGALAGLAAFRSHRVRAINSLAASNCVEAASTLEEALDAQKQLQQRAASEPALALLQRQFVVCTFWPGGLGNRFHELVSCFLLALLSQRVLVVHWPEVKPFEFAPGDVEGTQHHAAGSDLFRAPFEWTFAEQLLTERNADDGSADGVWASAQPLRSVPAFPASSGTTQLLTRFSLGDEHMALLTCEDLSHSPALRSDATFWIVRHSQYFGSHLHLNPRYRPAFARWFGAPGAAGQPSSRPVFGTLLAYLVQPHQKILARVADFERLQLASAGAGEADTAAAGAAAGSTQPRLLQQRPRPASRSSSSQSRPFTLGVHLRTIVAYDSIRVDRSHERDLLACAERLLANRSDAVVYIAADSVETRKRAQERLGVERTRVLEAETTGQGSSFTSTETSLVEMLLLARTDALVISPHSTFSTTAAAWSDKGLSRPVWTVYTADGTCELLPSSEPCAHSWRKLLLTAETERGHCVANAAPRRGSCGLEAEIDGAFQAEFAYQKRCNLLRSGSRS